MTSPITSQQKLIIFFRKLDVMVRKFVDIQNDSYFYILSILNIHTEAASLTTNRPIILYVANMVSLNIRNLREIAERANIFFFGKTFNLLQLDTTIRVISTTVTFSQRDDPKFLGCQPSNIYRFIVEGKQNSKSLILLIQQQLTK